MNDRSDAWQPLARHAAKARLPDGLAGSGPRQHILEAALRLFASKGFHGASIRDIASLAAMQPSAVYAHFPSKEHVLAELARAGHEAQHRALQAALLEAGKEPLAQLSALVRANTLVHVTYPHAAMVINAELYALSEELAAPALAIRGQSAALLVQVLERGVRKGAFVLGGATEAEAALARMATAAALGAMGMRLPYWYSIESGPPPDALADAQVRLAARMVGAAT